MTTLSLSPDTQAIFNKVGYYPTREQLPILMCQRRFVLVTGGQQSGKSETSTKLFIDRWNEDIYKWQPCVVDGISPERCPGHDSDLYPWLRNGKCDPELLYWLVGSEYAQAEEEFERIYQDLVEIHEPAYKSSRVDTPGWIRVQHKDERRPRMSIAVKSEAKPDRAFTRVSPHGIIACEAGQMSYQTFRLLNSRTIGKKGWLFLIGTIEKAQPWYPAMAKSWAIGNGLHKSFELPTWSNTYLFPGGRNDPEIRRMEDENPEDFFMERIAGKSVPPEGLVFAREFNFGVHVQEVGYRSGETVYIWIDPGYQRGESAYALYAAHIIQGQIRIFDEIHEYGMTTEDIIGECQQNREWWNASDKRLAIDPYYKNVHHAQGSVEETWRRLTGLSTSRNNKRVQVNEADNRLKEMLKLVPGRDPKLVINPKCQGLISEFGVIPSPHSSQGEILAYRWKLDNAGNPIGRHPESRHCDGIRAIETGIVDQYGIATSVSNKKKVTFRGGKSRNGLTKMPHERLMKS